MRILAIFFSVALLFSSGVLAKEGFNKMASKKPELVQKGEEKGWCPVCGMSLKGFYKTSHTASTKEGEPMQYCSIRCLVLDHQNRKTDLSNVQVVDVVSEKLILAKDAYYVVGSKVPGTMSKVSKLAFKSEDEAKSFAKKMGGEIKRFDEVYKIAEASLQDDIVMINAKRAKKMYPMGKKVFASKCDARLINLNKFNYINEIKPVLKRICQEGLKEKQLQAVALYLWDVVRFENDKATKRVEVQDADRCPVCGMFVKKYPRWAAKMTYEHDGHEHYFAFDGVKDMAKYMLEPQKYGGKVDFKAKEILVTDYYTQYAIDGRKAFYVVGSDILGPMGHELIPFEKKSDAKTFKNDHKGTEILTLDEITASLLCKLDGQKCD